VCAGDGRLEDDTGSREELLTSLQKSRVKTLLNDPFSRKPAVPGNDPLNITTHTIAFLNFS